MIASLRVPRSTKLKFDRAAVHLQVLKREIEHFFNSDLNTPIFTFQPNPDTGEVRVRATKPLPSEWSLLIGDCIYNFRSGLDHLVWATILKYGGHPTPRNEFPIFLDKMVYFELDRKQRNPTPRSGLSKVAGLPGEMQTVIESLQPYNRTDGAPDLHPLWLLQGISNEDKHRLLNVVHAAMRSGTVSINAFEDGQIERFTLPAGPLEDRALVHTIRPRIGSILKAQVDMKFKFTPGVRFDPNGPGRGMPVIETLADISRFIMTEVLPPIRPFIL